MMDQDARRLLNLPADDNFSETGPLPDLLERLLDALPGLERRLIVTSAVNADVLETAIREAEAVPGALAAQVRKAAMRAEASQVERSMHQLVSAWPNASIATDVFFYRRFLTEDVGRQRPSEYALLEAGRSLRRCHKTLPTISEVLDEIETANDRIVSAAWAIEVLPGRLKAARVAIGWSEIPAPASGRQEVSNATKRAAGGSARH